MVHRERSSAGLGRVSVGVGFHALDVVSIRFTKGCSKGRNNRTIKRELEGLELEDPGRKKNE